jgi:hypothetical protein
MATRADSPIRTAVEPRHIRGRWTVADERLRLLGLGTLAVTGLVLAVLALWAVASTPLLALGAATLAILSLPVVLPYLLIRAVTGVSARREDAAAAAVAGALPVDPASDPAADPASTPAVVQSRSR